MQYTISELWAMLSEHKSEIKSLRVLVLQARTERTEMQQRIDQLTQDNAWLVGSRKRHMDACTIAEAGIETLTKTCAWLADHQHTI